MVSLATPVDRTLYFDFLPIRVPTSRDMTVRLQLFTVPGQVYFNATRKLVLTGADGVVFVADSQPQRADANIESFRNLEENLAEQGRSLDEMPHVFAYNKRDLPGLTPIDEMEQLLNTRGAPSFATVATLGEGVYEALEAITRGVIEDFDHRVPEHRGLSPSPLMLPEGGLAEALRLVEGERDSWSVQAPAKAVSTSELEFSLPADDDVGEAAARVVAEAGTRPGLGLVSSRPPGNRRAFDQENLGSSKPESNEQAAQSHFRPVPVPLNGFGMHSSPPPPLPSEPPPSETPRSSVENRLSGGSESSSVALATSENDEANAENAGCSLSLLWPSDERATVLRVEQAIIHGDTRDAVLLVDILMQRLFEALAQATANPNLNAATAVALLDLRGEDYLNVLCLVERARASNAPFTKAEALRSLLFATSLCAAQSRVLV
jgi:signal recognition particle receptor subunit beta